MCPNHCDDSIHTAAHRECDFHYELLYVNDVLLCAVFYFTIEWCSKRYLFEDESAMRMKLIDFRPQELNSGHLPTLLMGLMLSQRVVR